MNIQNLNTEYPLEFNELLNHLILDYQENFPLENRPFRKIADDLKVQEADVLKGYQFLKEKGILSRLGPIFTTHRVGYSFLAAIKCPEDRILEVSSVVNSFEEVNHNYLRENELNMWFVCTGKDKETLDRFVKELESKINLKVYPFPMKRAFKIDLKAREKISWEDVL